MPYIKQNSRNALCESFNGFYRKDILTAGELNYVLSKIIHDYFLEHPDYQGINDIIGALEGAKLEFYRRVVAPYEDIKIIENGDIY